MGKPLIGVSPLWDDNKGNIWMLPQYLEAIERAGGVPVILPLTDDHQAIEQLAGSLDGFLFTGGQDLSPALYGQAPLEQCGPICERRDALEKILFEKAVLERDKPALGICRGVQLINALLGGTLYQDLPSQRPSDTAHRQPAPYDVPSHSVSILPETPLHQLIHATNLRVNSLHHQAIHALADRLTPMALSEDGLVEAVYMSDRRYVYGIQWHPEYMLDSPHSARLFESFVQACG